MSPGYYGPPRPAYGGRQ